ncbi:MAG: hypothetical protein MK192_02335 [Idiomarina sp.]|nr:hypothetical protein [Idiomarina sp.]
MFIAVHKTWQINDAFTTAFDDKDLMRFNFVELTVNAERFIVELTFQEKDTDSDDEYTVTNQYLAATWREAVELTKVEGVLKNRISIIIPRFANRKECDKYAIQDIDEIFRVENTEENGDFGILFRLADQSEYFTHISSDDKKYTIKDCVYSNKES